MKTRIIYLVIILAVATLSQGCKDPALDYQWFLVEGQGSYNSDSNTSGLKLNAWLKISQSSVNINPNSSADITHFQYASVASWSFRLFQGEELVFEVSSVDIGRVLGDIFINIAKDQYDYLWVAIESQVPLEGDVFNGMNPDRLEVSIGVYDDSGSGDILTGSSSFAFSRN